MLSSGIVKKDWAGAIVPFSQESLGRTLVGLARMKPTERLRELVGLALKLGITQKTLAGYMNVSESTLSRWYNREPDSKGNLAKIPGDALDSFEDFIDEVTKFTTYANRTRSPQDSVTLPDMPMAESPTEPGDTDAEPESFENRVQQVEIDLSREEDAIKRERASTARRTTDYPGVQRSGGSGSHPTLRKKTLRRQ